MEHSTYIHLKFSMKIIQFITLVKNGNLNFYFFFDVFFTICLAQKSVARLFAPKSHKKFSILETMTVGGILVFPLQIFEMSRGVQPTKLLMFRS